jgi:caa(3)-type oxidase subunit IV
LGQEINPHEAQGGFAIGQAVSHDAGYEIDEEIEHRSVAGVLDLAEVFQFIENGFDEGTAAQDGFLELGAGHGFHLLLKGCTWPAAMHDTKPGTYLGIWLVLLALPGANIAVAFINLGALNAPLTVAIAAIQAFLIVSFFMYLRTGAPVARIAAGAGFFWLLIMIGLVLGNYGTRFEDSELGRPRPEVDWGVPAESNKTRPIQ